MTKMRMKSPAFSILKININYWDLFKKIYACAHTEIRKGLDKWNTAKLMNFVSGPRWVS